MMPNPTERHTLWNWIIKLFLILLAVNFAMAFVEGLAKLAGY